MISTEPIAEDRELRALIGMAGPTAAMMLTLLLLTTAAMLQRHLESAVDPLLVISCYLLLAIAAVVVLLVPTDPLPVPAALFVVVVGPVTTAMALYDAGAATSAEYVPWPSSTYALVLSALILRRRPCFAWGAVAVSAVVFAVGAWMEGVSRSGVLATLAVVGTIVAVTVFAMIMRPTLESLESLRVEATARAAAEATLTAQSEERDRQLDRLDARARPMLDKIALGEKLTATEREECRLLEAELRDSLRAPRLAVAEVVTAARDARSNGVEVVLLDDGGFADAAADVRAAVLAEAASALRSASGGSVTVRVLPAGKRYLASVVVSGPERDLRTEIGYDGESRTANLS